MIDIKEFYYEIFSIKKCFLKYILLVYLETDRIKEKNIKKCESFYNKIKLNKKEKIFFDFLKDYDEKHYSFYSNHDDSIKTRIINLWFKYWVDYSYRIWIIFLYFLYYSLDYLYQNKYTFNLKKYSNKDQEIYNKDLHKFNFLHIKYEKQIKNNCNSFYEYCIYLRWWKYLFDFIFEDKKRKNIFLKNFKYFLILNYFIQTDQKLLHSYNHIFCNKNNDCFDEENKKYFWDLEKYKKIIWYDLLKKEDIKLISIIVWKIFRKFY